MFDGNILDVLGVVLLAGMLISTICMGLSLRKLRRASDDLFRSGNDIIDLNSKILEDYQRRLDELGLKVLSLTADLRLLQETLGIYVHVGSEELGVMNGGSEAGNGGEAICTEGGQ